MQREGQNRSLGRDGLKRGYEDKKERKRKEERTEKEGKKRVACSPGEKNLPIRFSSRQ